ncbi:MAG TPA: hypothetical protein VF101_14830 [Gaiellaceae bacterium]
MIEICGDANVAAFKEVKLTSMRLARAVKEVIAEELDGDLPRKGKHFLRTEKGIWRLAARENTDNTTEERAHKRMGAHLVQVFGDINERRRERGWITVEELYGRHGVHFDGDRIVKKVIDRLR